MAGGATAAECVIREGDEFSTVVRLGQVETLKEAGSRAIGVRVFQGQRAASTYSSDFSREGLDRMLKSALELSKITSEDPFRQECVWAWSDKPVPSTSSGRALSPSKWSEQGQHQRPGSLDPRRHIDATTRVVNIIPPLFASCCRKFS